MGQAGFLLAQFKPRASRGIGGGRPAQDLLPVRRFLRLRSLDVLAHPVADFSVGDGFFDHGQELFVGESGRFEPNAVETFAEVLGVVGVQFAGQAQADFVDIARQIMPTGHYFTRTAGVDEVTHAAKMR